MAKQAQYKSKLQRIFGTSPHFRILEHFWLGHELDYSVADIFYGTQVSRPTISKVINILLEEKLIVQTRNARSQNRYQFNKENKEYFYLLNLIIKDAEKTITRDAMKKYSYKNMNSALKQ